MKVTITEISGAPDALAALGLTTWLADLGIDSDIVGVPLELSRKMLSADLGGGTPAAPAPVAAQPAKRPKKYAKRKAAPVVAEPKLIAKAIVKKATRKAVASPPVTSEDAPHVTIRQRIINALRSGPRRTSQIRTEPGMGSVDVSQHLYLMKKDGLVTLNENTGEYALVAA